MGLGWLGGAHRATGTGFWLSGWCGGLRTYGGAHQTLPRLRDAPPVLASAPPLVGETKVAFAPPLVGETEVAFYVAGCWCELRGQFQV